MTAYVLSISMTSLFGGAFGLITYGNSLLHVLGWYMIGGWIGLSLMIAAVAIANTLRGPDFSPAR